MPKPFQEWTVLPHGELVRLGLNLLSVTGVLHMPFLDGSRRMTVARLDDGRLVIYSAIALDEPSMQGLEGFGAPTFLIIPNDMHRLDARAWKDRYPGLTVIAPPAARPRVSEVVHVDATEADFGDSKVRYFVVPGTGGREAGMLVDTSGGTTLVLNDLIFNLANRTGPAGWLLRAIGLTGKEPRIPAVIKMREVKDQRALRAQLESWSRMRDLNRVIVSHGDPIVQDVPQVLSRLARKLAA